MIINILVTIAALWLIALTGAAAWMYAAFIRSTYARKAKDFTEKPEKEYIVPSGRFFSVKKKRAAIVNDDKKAWYTEKQENERLQP